MVKPRLCGMVVACICPQLVVVRDLRGVDCVGPVEEVVEVVTLCVHDGIDCYVGIGDFLWKLSSNPFRLQRQI